MPPVRIGAGVQLADPGLNQDRVVEQFRTQANQLFQLGKSHLAVDTERPELLGMRRLEVVSDKLGKVRQVRKSQTLEEIPPALPAEVVRRQPFEGRIFEVVQVLP